jgi:hypothetical protein
MTFIEASKGCAASFNIPLIGNVKLGFGITNSDGSIGFGGSQVNFSTDTPLFIGGDSETYTPFKAINDTAFYDEAEDLAAPNAGKQ